eukprot:TRINITY_DN12275_c0_g1_i2.p1 TRINITY_DN12275_c0_g1~~TRINITY_DN12275_c0_g1_i2.p1  ORF type:complete len:289 (-),score=26.33 TRINITY_DN12275_c0_g1_i2:14-880(-)
MSRNKDLELQGQDNATSNPTQSPAPKTDEEDEDSLGDDMKRTDSAFFSAYLGTAVLFAIELVFVSLFAIPAIIIGPPQAARFPILMGALLLAIFAIGLYIFTEFNKFLDEETGEGGQLMFCIPLILTISQATFFGVYAVTTNAIGPYLVLGTLLAQSLLTLVSHSTWLRELDAIAWILRILTLIAVPFAAIGGFCMIYHGNNVTANLVLMLFPVVWNFKLSLQMSDQQSSSDQLGQTDNCFSGKPLIYPHSCHYTLRLSLIHISEPTRLGMISYAVFCLKKKNIFEIA